MGTGEMGTGGNSEELTRVMGRITGENGVGMCEIESFPSKRESVQVAFEQAIIVVEREAVAQKNASRVLRLHSLDHL